MAPCPVARDGRARPRRARRPGGVVLVACVLLGACDRPKIPPASGTVTATDLLVATVPEGWSVQAQAAALELTRQTPYAGGYPTLLLRALDADEERLVAVEGRPWRRDGWSIQHRYRRWRGQRGQGYRLEGVARRAGLTLQFDAATWDDAATMDPRFFELEIWPIVLSARPAR